MSCWIEKNGIESVVEPPRARMRVEREAGRDVPQFVQAEAGRAAREEQQRGADFRLLRRRIGRLRARGRGDGKHQQTHETAADRTGEAAKPTTGATG